MKNDNLIIDFVLKEWLLIASGAGLVATSVYTRHIPVYSLREVQVLFILFVLFIAVKGLQHSGLISMFSRSLEKGSFIPVKLVVATFFLSMLVTNDIALTVIVPLTLLLGISHKDILVILEALAANTGSALTPFGNPQNLYIYWFYDLNPTNFVTTIAPLSLAFLVILIISASLIKTRHNVKTASGTQISRRSAYLYSALLIIVLLSVVHILPVSAGLIVILYALVLDRKALRIDYALLFSFFFFFGLADNIKYLLATEITHSGHIFLFSALASQIMSNVPAALLFVKFTTNWQALLWGTNAGGFGSLFGSLANLIAYKIYVAHEDTNNTAMFTVKFLVIGYAAFFTSTGLYFILNKP